MRKRQPMDGNYHIKYGISKLICSVNFSKISYILTDICGTKPTESLKFLYNFYKCFLIKYKGGREYFGLFLFSFGIT